MSNEAKRLTTLRKLLRLEIPLSDLSKELSEYEWDFTGIPLKLSKNDLKTILNKYLSGKLTSHELEVWANLIECREDLEYETTQKESIEEVINQLANPILYGEINQNNCRKMLKSIDEVN